MSEILRRLTERPKNYYRISRTSSWDSRPCEEAFQCEVMNVDRRSADDPKKIPAFNGTDGDWYERGSNHRVENGRICRDMGWRAEWFVEMEAEDIWAFADKYGSLVVQIDVDGWPKIEIYDDYRE
jgi:hypothetical protein